jgi:hypothetical protein
MVHFASFFLAMNIRKTTLFSALLGALTLSLGAADGALKEVGREGLAQRKMQSDVLQGLNGLVAAPALSDAKGLPRRLMG